MYVTDLIRHMRARTFLISRQLTGGRTIGDATVVLGVVLIKPTFRSPRQTDRRAVYRRATVPAVAMLATLLVVSLSGCESAPDVPVQAAVVAPAATPPWILPEVAEMIREPATDPASFCPANLRGYLRVDNAAQWRASGQSDPLVAHMWEAIQSVGTPACWNRAAAHLGMDNSAMLDTYFGQTVALVDQKIDGDHAVVVVSRVPVDVLKGLPEAAGLRPWDPTHPDEVVVRAATFGPFAIYTTDDPGEQSAFAIGRNWLMIVARNRVNHIRRLLTISQAPAEAAAEQSQDTADDQPLTGLESFHKLLAKLPSERTAALFTRNGSGNENHAAVVVRHGTEVTVHYAATGTELTRVKDRAEHSEGVDFGLLPASTVSAATVNMIDSSYKRFRILDTILFPYSVDTSVLTKLSPPMIGFLGQVPGDEVIPNPGSDVPVIGVAVKLKDPSAAKDLDRLISRVHFFANLGELDLIRSLFGIRRVKAGGTSFHVADFGRAISKRLRDPHLSPLIRLPSSAGLTRLSFGRIGQWYVICSQEAFYRRCIEAEADPGKRFDQTDLFRQFTFESKPRLAVSAVTRARELSALLDNTVSYYERAHTEAGAKRQASRRLGDLQEPLRLFAEALKHRHCFYLQLWHDDEGTLRGKLQVVDTPTPPTALAH